MAMVEDVRDWKSVFQNYNCIYDRLPEVNELVYIAHIGIFTVDHMFSNGDINIEYKGKAQRFPTFYYRLLESK
ncbi:hypothetical protein ABH961_005682 [Bacillus sp. RC251]|uniref:hypothetical protein n=1 Tax=Bacillus sp. RC251 TaxID=3156290 RepID=UPI00383873F5